MQVPIIIAATAIIVIAFVIQLYVYRLHQYTERIRILSEQNEMLNAYCKHYEKAYLDDLGKLFTFKRGYNISIENKTGVDVYNLPTDKGYDVCIGYDVENKLIKITIDNKAA